MPRTVRSVELINVNVCGVWGGMSAAARADLCQNGVNKRFIKKKKSSFLLRRQRRKHAGNSRKYAKEWIEGELVKDNR